jgi:endonuclease YncB( thermonuclease family)
VPAACGNRGTRVAWFVLAAAVTGAATTDAVAESPPPVDPHRILVGVVERVRDGDTLELEGRAIRLRGVAAPELRDPLGPESREALRQLVAGRTVACTPDGTRTYGRIVAVCTVDGRDLGAALVAAGLARDCPHYSGGRYAALERAAAARGAPIGRVYPLPAYCRPDR